MDTSSIGALTGTSDSKKRKPEASPGDADAFASVMGQASEPEGGGGKKSDLISKEESAKEKADKADASKKREAERDDKDAAKADRKKDAVAQGKVSDFLKNTASKDPATLSMAERQTFRLGEFAAQNNKPMGGMAQMLASQGIDMNSFSPQQIMSLLSRMDVQELGKMMSQMQTSGFKVDEESLKQLKEQLNAQMQNTPGKEQANFNLQDFMSAGMPKEAGEAARQEQRKAVMDQILSNIEVRNVANQTEMQLRLNPEYLGEVKISLIHDEDGGIRATFQTTSKATSEVLNENKEDLMDQARGKGVRIGSMDVEFVSELSA